MLMQFLLDITKPMAMVIALIMINTLFTRPELLLLIISDFTFFLLLLFFIFNFKFNSSL